ncbi:MAG TPA: arginine--tRNA ligase [Patescibacteria group bacterium]|nr:arginine--tRNA ligase [Patescibacteria group bacterium]
MIDKIRKSIEDAVNKARKSQNWPNFEAKIVVDYPKDEQYGDFTTNIAMVLAKKLENPPAGGPLEIAQIIKENIACDVIESVDIAAPGYINITLKKKNLQEIVVHINKLGKKYGESESGKGKKILIEFVSSNPTGPIHIGNARGGPLGDTLARVMEKSGFKTEREFYINDWGNQIEILGHSVLGDGEGQYKGDYIEDLRNKLNKNLTDPLEVGHWAAHMIIQEYIKPTCKKSGIIFDHWYSERDELHKKNKVDKIIDFLKKNDLTYEKDGALWYKSTAYGDDKDRVLIKADAKKTYIATDFAYHKEKVERGYDKLINIQGADHHKEAQVVKSFVEKVLETKTSIDYILTQIVKIIQDGQEIKMSKRKGTYFALDDLVEEVGRDAVRFIFLSYSPTNHINFDIDLAREQSEKNPVYYVQYAHARISSILKKADIMHFKFDKSSPVGLLEHQKELNLIRELAKFPAIVEEISISYEVHRLPFYAMKLADKFHSFYAECKVLDERNSELTGARLNLVKAVKIVLAEVLDLMGVEAPEKM